MGNLSVAEESFKFKESRQYSTTTFVLDNYVARPCLVHGSILFFYFLQLNIVTVFYFSAKKTWASLTASSSTLMPWKLFSWSVRNEGGGGKEFGPLLLYNPLLLDVRHFKYVSLYARRCIVSSAGTSDEFSFSNKLDFEKRPHPRDLAEWRMRSSRVEDEV